MRKEESQIIHRPILLVSVEFSGKSPPAIGCWMTRQRKALDYASDALYHAIARYRSCELIHFRYALQTEDMRRCFLLNCSQNNKIFTRCLTFTENHYSYCRAFIMNHI